MVVVRRRDVLGLFLALGVLVLAWSMMNVPTVADAARVAAQAGVEATLRLSTWFVGLFIAV
jgi:hypothetical protein